MFISSWTSSRLIPFFSRRNNKPGDTNPLSDTLTASQAADPTPGPGALLPDTTQGREAPGARPPSAGRLTLPPSLPPSHPGRRGAVAGPGPRQRCPPRPGQTAPVSRVCPPVPPPRLPAPRDLVSLIVKGQLFIFIVRGFFFPSGISRRRRGGLGGYGEPSGARSRPTARRGSGDGEEEYGAGRGGRTPTGERSGRR